MTKSFWKNPKEVGFFPLACQLAVLNLLQFRNWLNYGSKDICPHIYSYSQHRSSLKAFAEKLMNLGSQELVCVIMPALQTFTLTHTYTYKEILDSVLTEDKLVLFHLEMLTVLLQYLANYLSSH